MTERKASLCIASTIVLLVSLTPLDVSIAFAASSYSIELQGFRWNKFPLKVLVDMNKWSKPDYALAAREAVDSWIKSISTYDNLTNDTTLKIISYTFYVSSVNATSIYDVFITFTIDEISPNVVGLTTNQWNLVTHEPVPPITINITTYSGTASHLFVENVAMHEFGHALGLGHASSQNTLNGPELMYFSTVTDSVVYPSTLDLYGLTVLYEGSFNQSVQLPTSIPYETVQPTANNPPDTTPPPAQPNSDHIIESILKVLSVIIQHIWETDRINLIVLVMALLFLILVSAWGKKYSISHV